MNGLSVDKLEASFVEGEGDTSSDLDVGKLGFWGYLQFLKSLDPSERRVIFDLKRDKLFLKLGIFGLVCANALLQVRIFRLECRYGLRRFPWFHLETPNVKVRGAKQAATPLAERPSRLMG